MCVILCVPVYLELHLLRRDVRQTIGKHLGLLVDPSGFCSAQQATLPGSVNRGFTCKRTALKRPLEVIFLTKARPQLTTNVLIM